MGCTHGKSIEVVDTSDKPGDPPNVEENNQAVDSEVKSDSSQCSSTNDVTDKS